MDPVVDVTLRAVLALLLAGAARHKLRDPARFRATLAAYRLVPAALSGGIAAALIGVELGVAGALLVPALRGPAGVAAALLLSLYAGAVAINLARGRRDLDCGCAGPALRRPIDGWLVARNVVLATAALAGLVPLRPRSLVWVDALSVVGATAVLAACYTALERLHAQAPAFARLRGDA